jgi:thioredoxin 1
MALEFTNENFEKEVIESEIPVLVDFWAVWCGPCKMLTPTIDQLSSEYEGKVKIGKVNVDENQEIAAKYGIMSIPTIMIFKNGQVVEQFIGVQPKTVYAEALNKYV